MNNAFAPQPFDEFDDEFDVDAGYVTPAAAGVT
jgi:pilus assembly protein CpaE